MKSDFIRRMRSRTLAGGLLAVLSACGGTSTMRDAQPAGNSAPPDTHSLPSVGGAAGSPSSVTVGAAGTAGQSPIATSGIGGVGDRTTVTAGSSGTAGTRGEAGVRAGNSAGSAGVLNTAGGGGSAGVSTGPASGAGGAAASDDCVEDGGSAGASPPKGSGSSSGKVFFYSPSGNPFVRFRTKMIVPTPPTANKVLFLWPGLQPGSGGRNYNPIGQGVLQPVLTWGPSCAPNQLGSSYDSWWISAQYVNTIGKEPGFTGCHGGPAMKVGVGDVLDIDMSLSGTSWKQTVTDEKTGKSVAFDFDLMAQDQDEALFIIEDTYNSPSEDLIFRSSVLTYASPAASACKVSSQGANDFVVTPRPINSGLECCIPRVVLRAKGVPATSPN